MVVWVFSLAGVSGFGSLKTKILVTIEAISAVIFKSVSVEQVSASSIKGSIVSDGVCRLETKKPTYVP